MAETTRRLGLPLLAAAQAQKHVTHNEALTALDALVQLACLDKDLTSPPASPAEGDRYLIASSSPTGAWAGLSGQIVRRQDGVWVGSVPSSGWLAYVIDEADLYTYSGTAWVSFRSGLTALQNLTRLGIGTTADATNRLAVKSEAALFSWDDVTPGTGSLRLALNKQVAAKDAALSFQTGFSARALFGLLGDNNVTVKVSPDGSTFYNAIVASASTGWLTLNRVSTSGSALEVSGNAGSLPATTAGTVLRVSGADAASPVVLLDAFGSNVNPTVGFRVARGSAAAPTAVQSSDVLGQFGVYGYGATSYSGSTRAKVTFRAAETWTDAIQSMRIGFEITLRGTATRTETFGVEANGAVSLAPLPADPSAGAALGQLYANSTATALKWYNGTAWARLNNFAKAAAYASADTYAAAGTWTKVAFNNADGNDQGAFVAATNRFVAPEAGLYAFSVALVFKKNGSNNPSAMEIQLYKNGAAAGRGRASATGTLVDGVTALDLSSALKLAATDYVEVFVRFTTTDGYAAAADSFFGAQQQA